MNKEKVEKVCSISDKLRKLSEELYCMAEPRVGENCENGILCDASELIDRAVVILKGIEVDFE